MIKEKLVSFFDGCKVFVWDVFVLFCIFIYIMVIIIKKEINVLLKIVSYSCYYDIM